MEDTEADRYQQILKNHTAQLLEHFESVRVFVTRPGKAIAGGPSLTAGGTEGGGNYFAQLGQVRHWLLTQEEYMRMDARNDYKTDGED